MSNFISHSDIVSYLLRYCQFVFYLQVYIFFFVDAYRYILKASDDDDDVNSNNCNIL